MKWISIFVGALAALGCQGGQTDEHKPKPVTSVHAVAPAYVKDIEKLCGSMTLSGADQLPADARTLTIANWLAANLTTPESRTFMIEIQPLQGEPHAQALETEAKRVGLPGCALAAEWRTPTP
jgi:hypothetical protein